MSGFPAPFEVLDEEQLRARSSLKWQHYGRDVVPVWVAEMDVLPAPEVVAAVTAAVRDGDTGYPDGGVAYREALAGFAEHLWGWSPDPARMLLCADVMSGIRALVERITPRGGSVIIPSPVYPPFSVFTRESGRNVVQVPLTGAGRLDVAAIEQALLASVPAAGHEPSLVLLCSPHNPTGAVHSAAELGAVAEAARRTGAVVVVDEVHAPLVPADRAFVPWLSITDRGFVVTSAAKAFNLAGFKAGLIVAGPGSAAVLKQLPVSVAYGGSHLGVIAHAAAYTASGTWLEAVNANIAANRDLLAELVAQHLPGVRFRVPEATYLAWLDLRDVGLGDDPARLLLTQGRVALTSGRPFGRGGSGHVRLNFACSRRVLTEAVHRMAAVIDAAPTPGQRPAAG